MSEPRFSHGAFCWADLATIDPVAAKTFYAALFGWSFIDHPVAADMIYSIASLEAGTVGGLFGLPPQMCTGEGLPCWTPYVCVDDIDGVAGKAALLGGRVLYPPGDVPDTGRMATIADPQGAALSLWSRASRFPGYDRLGGCAGTVCWNELATNDVDGAAGFYGALFGWSVKKYPQPEFTYVTFCRGDETTAGMLPVHVAGPDIPPHWLVYFTVDDCDAAAATAASHGGNVLKPPFEVPQAGRLAVVADPQGAAFALLALAPCA